MSSFITPIPFSGETQVGSKLYITQKVTCFVLDALRCDFSCLVMDRPKRGAQTVLEPLEEVSQRDIDMLVNAAWSPDSSEEQTLKKQNDLMMSSI